MKWLKALLSENGDVSSMRVMAIICVLTGCYLAIKDSTAVGMVATLLGSGMGGKALQKHAEAKTSDES